VLLFNQFASGDLVLLDFLGGGGRLVRGFATGGGRSASSLSFRVSVVVELNEEQEVGHNDTNCHWVGPFEFPGSAQALSLASALSVQIIAERSSSDVAAELNDLNNSDVLLPPNVDAQDGQEIVQILSNMRK